MAPQMSTALIGAAYLDIVAYGEPMVEFNQTGEHQGRAYLQGFGGDSSNFAIAAARQGARVGYLSAVGDDPYGHMLRELWHREGVCQRGVVTDAAAYTAHYFVTHGESGHQFQFFRAGSAASRVRPADFAAGAIEQAKLFHLSGISLAISAQACDTGFALIERARAAKVTVSFDTNLRLRLWPIARARAVMTEALRLCDIALPSYDDVVALTGMTDADALVDHCLNLGARTVALKLGDQGALVATAHQRHRIPAHPCRPVDATGAGDTFGGAFAARWVAGDTLADAARYAAVAAALSTEGYGAVEPIPRAGRVSAEMSRNEAC